MTLGGVVDANQDVARMSEAVDECFETPLSCLSAEELSDRLVAINNASARFDALRVETVAAAKAANVGTLNDQRNVANHVAERTNTNPADTRADQLIADWLTDFPELASAYRRGVMTTAHVNLLRRKDNPRVHSQLIDDQHKFVQWFRDIAFRDLDAVIERWLLGADPDGAEPKEHATECGLSLKPLPGGLLAVNGVLDPLMGHALKTAVHAKAKKIRARHKAAGISSTVRRRNLEALMLLVTTGYASEHDITLNPLVSIVTDQHTYEDTLDWLKDPHNNDLPVIDPDPSPGYAGRKSQLIDGTPIHPLYAIAASATAVFRRIVYDAKGRAIETSYDSRSFPPWIRDLVLIATNGKSANPVCDAPFHWLQTDHIKPDSHGGPTEVANARPLSEADNGWRGNDTTRGKWPMPPFAPLTGNPSRSFEFPRPGTRNIETPEPETPRKAQPSNENEQLDF